MKKKIKESENPENVSPKRIANQLRSIADKIEKYDKHQSVMAVVSYNNDDEEGINTFVGGYRGHLGLNEAMLRVLLNDIANRIPPMVLAVGGMAREYKDTEQNEAMMSIIGEMVKAHHDEMKGTNEGYR